MLSFGYYVVWITQPIAARTPRSGANHLTPSKAAGTCQKGGNMATGENGQAATGCLFTRSQNTAHTTRTSKGADAMFTAKNPNWL